MVVRDCGIRHLHRSLPENDQLTYYSDGEDIDDLDVTEPGPSQYTNRGQKLRVNDGVRWVHRGKLGSWTEARLEREVRNC